MICASLATCASKVDGASLGVDAPHAGFHSSSEGNNMIIAVASQKGGPGKTTLAVNIAVEAAAEGNRVVLVDADTQLSASRWVQDREERDDLATLARVVLVSRVGRLTELLPELDTNYDVVVVDLPGKESAEMRTALVRADTALIVVRPSQLDLDTLVHMSEVLEGVLDLNPELRILGVLNQVPTHLWGSETPEAVDVLSEYDLIKPTKTIIHDRKAYRDVMSEGLGVVEWTNAKARREIRELTQEVLNQ